MKKTALVIMAAGIGSRYGKAIKQLEAVGPNGEIIMDYSIYDAIEAGFNKVVFIIRKDIEKLFKETVGDRISKIIEVEYAYQSVDDLPEGFSVPEGRTKPWGTGQAVLCAKNVINEPFCVINADDYYGKSAFKSVHDFLVNLDGSEKFTFCCAGFILKNTLSENGTVTRGICNVDDNGKLVKVEETYEIHRLADGKVVAQDGDGEKEVSENAHVSMNMWGFTPDFIDELQKRFVDFLNNLGDNPLKKEYLLPILIGEMLEKKECDISVLESRDKWFGVTYAEDKALVQSALKALTESGAYPSPLWK